MLENWLASIPVSTILLWLCIASPLILFLVLAYSIYRLQRFWRGLHTLEVKDRFAIKNDFVKNAAQILGGAFFLFGLYFTWQNLAVTQERHRTDLFTKAIEQLGSDKLEVRLGGIYALERIARESEKDHWPIMEVLTAYVRQNAPAPKSIWVPTTPGEEIVEKLRKPKVDVEAVLTVIGRRTMAFGQGRLDLNETDLRGANLKGAHLEGALFWRSNLDRADLREAHLEKADLRFAYLRWALSSEVHLEGANLRRAHLENAYLQQAHLREANLASANLKAADLQEAHMEQSLLWGANLEGAILFKAHLEGTNLRDANLQGAKLMKSHLEGATLWGADLRRADLRGANLQGAVGLEREQLESAYTDKNTKLPDHLKEAQPEKPESK